VADGHYIAGTGSFAAEIASWAADSGAEIMALIELQRAERIGSTIHGFPVVSVEGPRAGSLAILGLGGDREAHWSQLEAAGWTPFGIRHPTAHIAESADVAATATIGPHVVIGAEASIGEHAILNRGALVGHHARIGRFATLNPGVNVGGNTEVGVGAFLGMSCTVVNGVSVGRAAIVAAGAVALEDVSAGVRVQGVPAAAYVAG
jgi:UDP-3-O-[3-hydroxymyristoyl] glucosamine N-acyltransferase